MKIYQYDFCNYKVCNPVTNEMIIDTEVCEKADSLIAYWLDDFFDKPTIKDKALSMAWDSYTAGNNLSDIDFGEFDRFLGDYENADWIVFKVTSNPFPGVCSDTWLVVDKDCEIRKDDGL